MDEIKEQLIRIDEHLKNDNDRINKLEAEHTQITQLTIKLAEISQQNAQLGTKIDALNAKVDELEKRPAKRWDALITAIIGAIVGVVVGFFLKG